MDYIPSTYNLTISYDQMKKKNVSCDPILTVSYFLILRPAINTGIGYEEEGDEYNDGTGDIEVWGGTNIWHEPE